MKKDLNVLLNSVRQRAVDTINLVNASFSSVSDYDVDRVYSPKELEPYDALSDRFVRAVEISLKFFRTYERYHFGENSETIRDLLHRMEKFEFITSVEIWMQMREVCNRIVRDYLPEQVREMYDMIMGDFGAELLRLNGRMKCK